MCLRIEKKTSKVVDQNFEYEKGVLRKFSPFLDTFLYIYIYLQPVGLGFFTIFFTGYYT